MKLNLKNISFLNHRLKKIFILLFVFFLTGCNINYDVLVNGKKQVEEKIRMINSNEMILKNKDSIGKYFNSQIQKYRGMETFQSYRFRKKIGNKNSNVTAIQKYKSLEEYSESPILKTLFEQVIIDKDDNYVSFKTAGYYYKENIYSDYVDTISLIEKITIRFKFYNNIIESNADEFDEKNNILIWTIDINDNDKHLYFKIGNEKKYDIIILDYFYRYIIKNVIIAIGVFGVAGAIIFISIYFHKKIKKANEL